MKSTPWRSAAHSTTLRASLLTLSLLALEVPMTASAPLPTNSPADPPVESPSPSQAFLEALRAPGPSPSLGAAADTQQWLVGSWDVDVIDYRDDGTPLRSQGEWHFAWILEGRALGDVWIAPPRGRRPPADAPGPGNRYGISVRFYDSEHDLWRLSWINPVTGAQDRLVGGRQGDQIVYTGHESDGTLMRWRFTEIRPDSFHWLGEASRNDGKTWRLEAEFLGRRRGTAAAADPTQPDLLQEQAAPPLESRWTSHWEWTDRLGLEALVVSREDDAIVAKGDILVVLDGTPTRVSYRLVYSRDWRFRRGDLRSTAGGTTHELEIVLSDAGAGRMGAAESTWRVNGEERPDLADCTDLDVMVTPFTNTPPLWRLDPAAGQARPLQVAWVRFPELEVTPVRQEYRRLGDAARPTRYLYRNLESGFEGELSVDEHRLVVDYGPWRRLAPGIEDLAR